MERRKSEHPLIRYYKLVAVRSSRITIFAGGAIVHGRIMHLSRHTGSNQPTVQSSFCAEETNHLRDEISVQGVGREIVFSNVPLLRMRNGDDDDDSAAREVKAKKCAVLDGATVIPRL